jgi:hypothetical protein
MTIFAVLETPVWSTGSGSQERVVTLLDAAAKEAREMMQARRPAMAKDCRSYTIQETAKIINATVAEINSSPYIFFDKYKFKYKLDAIITSAEKRLKELDAESRRYCQCVTGVPQKAMGYLRHTINAELRLRGSLVDNSSRQYLPSLAGEGTGFMVSAAAVAISGGLKFLKFGLAGVAGATGGIIAISIIISEDKKRTLNALAPNPILPLSPENIAAMMQHEAKQWAAFDWVAP